MDTLTGYEEGKPDSNQLTLQKNDPVSQPARKEGLGKYK